MNRELSRNLLRLVFILVLQILVLKRIDINVGNFNYLHLLIYPLFIMLLPINTPKTVVIVMAFFYGMFIDLFYDSPGVHAGALVLMAYVRSFLLKILEPTEGYTGDSTPTIFRMGVAWFIVYAAILLFIHHIVYFSLDAFSYVFIVEILLRTIFSFIMSLIILMIVMFITNPRY